MGKSKKAWKNIEDSQRDDVILDPNHEKSVTTISNSSLFFIDAKGHLGGMEDLKRKKKRSLEQVQESTSSKDDSSVLLPQAKEQKLTPASLIVSAVITPSSTTATAVAVAAIENDQNESGPTKMEVSRPSGGKVDKWRRRQATGLRVVTKAANIKDDQERKLNLARAGMTFDPNLEMVDLWAEDQDPEKGVKLEKIRNKGFEVDSTPLEVRKRKYLRPRSAKQVELSKELVDPKGLDVAPSGASFNPDEDERQKALLPAYERDEKERAEAAALRKRLNPPSNVVENALPEEDDESELFPNKKLAKPKTRVQKNAKLRQIQEAYDKTKQKQQATINKQIDRLGSVLSEVKNDEKRIKARQEHLNKLKEHPDHRPKTSKHAFEAPFPEVPLEDELTQDRSMRTLTPSIQLMKDQFKRFQEKNIIEPRNRISGLKRRDNRKSFTRKSHKDLNDAFPCKASKT